MIAWPIKLHRQTGFSLIELAIILLILAALAHSLLNGLNGQQQSQRQQLAGQHLAQSVDNLLAFASINGRLPCPANPSSTVGAEDCTREHGILPWRTLGQTVTDPWGHHLSYYANRAFSAQLETGNRSSFTLDTLGNAEITDGAGRILASDLPAVVICHGPNGSGAWQADGNLASKASGEEAENADSDLSFISHPPGPTFDDQIIWINANQLKARLIQSGRLP